MARPQNVEVENVNFFACNGRQENSPSEILFGKEERIMGPLTLVKFGPDR